MKEITNYNSKGDYHGYQQWYGYQEWYTDRLSFRGNYKNNERIGYTEYHGTKQTRFNII